MGIRPISGLSISPLSGSAPLAGWRGLIGSTVIQCGGPTCGYVNDDWLRFEHSSHMPPAPHMTRAGAIPALCCHVGPGKVLTTLDLRHVSGIGQYKLHNNILSLVPALL